MISGLLGRMLASVVLKKAVTSVLLAFLKAMVKKTDNSVDDQMVDALEKALNG